MRFKGKTFFISGASRGIGLAIAEMVAREGANVTIAAKTAEPHGKLPGTIYTAAEAIERAGGAALPLVVDVRDEMAVRGAVEQTVARFGGIDVCVNNASAISLTRTEDTELKRYDLMHQINLRGTFLVSKACVPHLRKSSNPHVLNLSPPINLDPAWYAPHVAYTISKMGMSLCALGMAQEFAADGIAFNGLWPITTIDTSAVRFVLGGESLTAASRTPEIMAEAAGRIFAKPSRSFTGRLLIDELFLREEGITDFSQYAVTPDAPLQPDMFVSEDALAETDTVFGQYTH